MELFDAVCLVVELDFRSFDGCLAFFGLMLCLLHVDIYPIILFSLLSQPPHFQLLLSLALKCILCRIMTLLHGGRRLDVWTTITVGLVL